MYLQQTLLLFGFIAALADAILDRLIHSSHKTARKGESMRKQKINPRKGGQSGAATKRRLVGKACLKIRTSTPVYCFQKPPVL